MHAIYETEAAPWLRDPWQARDAYGVFGGLPVAPDPDIVHDRLSKQLTPAGAALDSGGRRRLGALLEMERNAMRVFTSCAWFFDDMARLEPLQVLSYAERAIELSGHADALRGDLLATLEQAPVHDERWTHAADLYRDKVMRSP